MSKDKKTLESRKKLIDISIVAKELRQQKCLNMTINEILLKFIYDIGDAKEFNTFYQWKEKGYTVLKGAKAFLIWGQPIKGQRKEENKDNKKESTPEDEYKYFPLCYLFSDKQVHKIEITKDEPKHHHETILEPEFLEF